MVPPRIERETMLTIKAADGRKCILSDEIYVIGNDDHPSPMYRKGGLVRKISGVDGSSTPGYHFMDGFCTVCSVYAKEAQFCGIEISKLKRLGGL